MKKILGIELGSTRIKAILLDENKKTIATGEHTWENKLIDGIWTYDLNSAWTGLQDAFAQLKANYATATASKLTSIDAIGISAMMHGYLSLDKNDNLLAPFRTWRNTNADKAADTLTQTFGFNVPMRWNIAQLYQSVTQDMEHVKDIAFTTTLAGYVHYKLTGKKVLGINDASGMFPIESATLDYNKQMLAQFDQVVTEKNYPWKLEQILPKVLVAGDDAGSLTEEGARLLDPTGELNHGALLCPPEGDVATGMVATNTIGVGMGNVSAGTSIFSMIVLEKDFTHVVKEIDIVNTPSGKPVAMAHANNCTSDIDAWVNLFGSASAALGNEVDKTKLYHTLYNLALDADANCGGLISYNFLSGEPTAGTDSGRPLFVREQNANFNLPNFMRAQLFASVAPLRIGMDILEEKGVKVEKILGHGGYFKTKGVGQRIMAAALNVPVEVMESAAEGGAWGIAVLASYRLLKDEKESLETYLNKAFEGAVGSVVEPLEKDVQGFEEFYKAYMQGLEVQYKAVEKLK